MCVERCYDHQLKPVCVCVCDAILHTAVFILHTAVFKISSMFPNLPFRTFYRTFYYYQVGFTVAFERHGDSECLAADGGTDCLLETFPPGYGYVSERLIYMVHIVY